MWGIEIGGMDKPTQDVLRDLAPKLHYAADSGVHLPELFARFQQMGANSAQIQQLAGMLSGADGQTDWAGQFGKYAHPETILANLQHVMERSAYPDKPDTGFLVDHGDKGGWLGRHAGTALRIVTNPLDAATGGKISGWTGDVGNALYRNLTPQRGWLGKHVWGDHGALSGVTRALNTFSVGAVTPGSVAPVESALQADYQNNRNNLKMTPRQALGNTIGNSATIASTALTFGAGSAFSPWIMALTQAGIGATRGAAQAYGAGKSPLRGAGAGGVGGLISAAVPGGGAAGAVARGVASGAASSALAGDNRNEILDSSIASGAAAAIGSATNPAVGRVAGGLIRTALKPRTPTAAPPIDPNAPSLLTQPPPVTSPWMLPGR